MIWRLATVAMLAWPLPAWANSSDQQPLTLERDPLIQADTRRTLASPEYRFCNDESYRFWEEDKTAICSHLDQFPASCPALEPACQRPSWEKEFEDEGEEWDLPWLRDLAEAFGAGFAWVMRAAFWLLVVTGVILVLRALLRHARAARELERGEGVSMQPLAQLDSTQEVDLTETRATALLEQANQALAHGEVRKALHLAYFATVRTLSDRGWLEPHRSKTSGDYMRALGPKPETEQERDLIRSLDRARYKGSANSEEAKALTQRVARLLQRTSSVAVILLSFLTTSCKVPSVPEAPRAPTAPRGHQLLIELIEERSTSVRERYHRVTEVPEDTTAILALGANLRPLEWRNIEQWVSEGGHLVVASPGKEFEEAFSLSFERSFCAAPPRLGQLDLITLWAVPSLSPNIDAVTLSTCGKRPTSIRFPRGRGHVTVVSDEKLLNNAHLAAGDNATMALFLLGNTWGHVEILGPWTGKGALNPWQSIARAGFSPWVLHLLLLFALYGWAFGRRFGTPKDPVSSPRRSLKEHAQALAHHYRRAHASGLVLSNYAEWVYEQMRLRGASARTDLHLVARSVSANESDATRLKRALNTARRAGQLGETEKRHVYLFSILKGAMERLRGDAPARTSTKAQGGNQVKD